MSGKDKCKYLKSIRKNIAEQNDIPLEQHECTFEGECKGTCPHCESELRYIEEQLERRRKLGKAAAAIAMSATLAFSAGCVPDVSGDVPYETPTDTEIVELTGEEQYVEEEGYVSEEDIEDEQIEPNEDVTLAE